MRGVAWPGSCPSRANPPPSPCLELPRGEKSRLRGSGNSIGASPHNNRPRKQKQTRLTSLFFSFRRITEHRNHVEPPR